VVPRHLDRDRVESWKTTFYQLEGYDPRTGWPTRDILQSFGMEKIMDEMADRGKLPDENT
jgi:aldehyde:ferredoxin oxidoreductase